MPSFRCKIKKLCYQGILTEKETERILVALDIKDALDKAGDTAEWKLIDAYRFLYECSNCRQQSINKYRFCPWCGAIMKRVEE